MAASNPAEIEAQLVRDAQAGDLAAFDALVRRYAARIFRLARNITGNEADAEDVLQEAFLKAYSRLGQFQAQSRFYTWLVRIAVNEALMKLRARRQNLVSLDQPEPAGDDNGLPRDVSDWRPNPEQQYARTELADILRHAMDSLSLPYRAVFQLRDIEELSTEETAQALGISVPAVKSRLLRARLQLRERLARVFGQPDAGTPLSKGA